MTMMLTLDSTGAINVVGSLTGKELLSLNLDLYTRLGDGVQLQLFFNAKKKTISSGSDVVLRTKWVDTVTGDVILDLSGTLTGNEEDTSSYLSIAENSGEFRNIALVKNAGWTDAIKLSTGFNAPNSLGRNKTLITITTELPDAFNADNLYKILTTMQSKPSYLVLPSSGLSEVDVYTTVLRATQKLNTQMKAEIDPSLTVDQACAVATALDAQDHRVEFLWSPNKCRPRDAVSLTGKKQYCYSLGAYVGMLLLRNANTSSQGIPMIADPVAGHDFPFTYKAMEQRDDISLGDDELEALAIAKINVVRSIDYDTGTKFVLSDVLTQYQSENSALRLTNASEIATYTTNRVIDILRRHMLKKTTTYIDNASKDIGKFLSACANSSVGLLQPSDDLGGNPYTFKLTPDEQYPFERVRLYLARRTNGAVRAVIFDDYVTK
ncbi:MAG: hypothetical protein [Bacteriophage sp.]|nr:MAG: hypothetical protein [Bacteriophage sp.]